MYRVAAASFAAAAGSGWHVYVVETKSGKLYTGITTDITRRLRQHAGIVKGGSRILRGDPPVRLRYAEPAENRSAASRREVALKRLPRAEKLRLLAGGEADPEARPQRELGGCNGGDSFNGVDEGDDGGGRGGGEGGGGVAGVVALTSQELAALDPLRGDG